MAQQYSLEAVNTFVRGLITEAGPLTFPKDASVDELNCDLKRDGSRRRRLGIEYEPDHELSVFAINDLTTMSIGIWENVDNVAGVNFAVVQYGFRLAFYEMTGVSLSENIIPFPPNPSVPFTVNLSLYNRPGGLGAENAQVEVTSINGGLVVASPEINTILVEYSSTSGNITVTEIDFKVRDFEWVGDNTSDYSTETSDNTERVRRTYDSLNAGWSAKGGRTTANVLEYYRTAQTHYPPLNVPWFVGKDSAGRFSDTEFDILADGNTLITNGHYILDLYTKDRQTASGIATVPNSPETSRFSTVASFSGRVFYSGMQDSTNQNNSRVYFSQLLVSGFDEIGHCYQVNDPTAETYNDLLDSDGGFISIPEAYNIQKLHVFGATLYVFAENGIWSISGVDDVFRATEYSVAKITETGLLTKGSFISAQGRPYWWSTTGIYTLITQEFSVSPQSISVSTIQTFWEEIGNTAKQRVNGIYDERDNRVMWLYPDDNELVENKRNNVLVFDENLKAFFPWKFSDELADTNYVIGAVFYDGTGLADIEFNVVDSDGDQVIDSLGNEVVATFPARSNSTPAIKWLVKDGTTNKVTFAELTGTDFLDWGTANYSSFAESYYNFIGDINSKKNAPYITSMFKVTETGWTGNETTGYNPIRPSSCKMSYIWDFKDSPSSTPQEAYRLKPMPIVNTSSLTTFGYPFSVVTTRLKLRGRGRNVRVKFESSEGKDFHLLGYEVIYAKNPRF